VTLLPMFPLGVVHFPHVVLPLRVFEPRYRALTADVLAGDRRFGVVLIERGSEVGGGDSRFAVGTVTAVVDAAVDEGGVIHLQTVGTGRIGVLRWLDEDPYPLAEVAELAPPVVGDRELECLAVAEREVRRALALRAELDEHAAPFNVALDDDPARALFQLAAIAPLGPADQQRVLATEEPAAMLTLLARLAADEASVLAHRLAGN
jgi:Lon protease-like protein